MEISVENSHLPSGYGEWHLARFAPVYLYFIVTHQCKLRSIHRLKNFDKIYIFLLKRACNESVMTSPRKHNIVER